MTHIQKAYFVHGEHKLVSSGFFYMYILNSYKQIYHQILGASFKIGPMLRVCLFSRDTSIRFQDFADATWLKYQRDRTFLLVFAKG